MSDVGARLTTRMSADVADPAQVATVFDQVRVRFDDVTCR
jgi:hypothetical protein